MAAKMEPGDSCAVMAIWRDGDKTVVQAWDELTMTQDGTAELRPWGVDWRASVPVTRLEGTYPRSLMVRADSQADATAQIFADLTRRATEAEEALRKANITPHSASALTRALLESRNVEVEDIDNSLGAWPTTDRIERRQLDRYDPLARDIAKRLDPNGTLAWDTPLYMTTTFSTGGYSEYTQEYEYELAVEYGPYIVTTGASYELELDALIKWIDGHDVPGIRVTTKGQA